ncbi:MAG: archaemetzincin, partial [Planctomycetota bacterium]
DPPSPQGERRWLYVAPLGPFTHTEESVLAEACEYLERYFCIPVKRIDRVPLPISGGGEHELPRSAVRLGGRGFGPQVRSEWVLQKLLRPLVPDDAALLIGFTARDLWPGRSWNFVFGQADLRRRVGVWSMARLGGGKSDEEGRRTLLRRTLKVATHEAGHMLGMRHCVAFACNMNGSNHLAESDRQPMHMCPVCTAKLAWAVDLDLAERGRQLASWAEGRGLSQVARAAWLSAADCGGQAGD